MRELMKSNWKGYWIMGVALLHNFYAVIMYQDDYYSLFENGVFDSITTIHVSFSVWFFLFGNCLFLVGVLVKNIELSNGGVVPISIAFQLLVITLIGVTLIPDSGFWLVFPVILAIITLKRPIVIR